jgi:hypothetical protein
MGATGHELGRKYTNHEWMYLHSSLRIKSVIHNAAKSVNRSILKKSRHLGFGVFEVHSSMPLCLRKLLKVSKWVCQPWALSNQLTDGGRGEDRDSESFEGVHFTFHTLQLIMSLKTIPPPEIGSTIRHSLYISLIYSLKILRNVIRRWQLTLWYSFVKLWRAALQFWTFVELTDRIKIQKTRILRFSA